MRLILALAAMLLPMTSVRGQATQPTSQPSASESRAVPSIAGHWQENEGTTLTVVQTGRAWKAECVYATPETGEVRWVMEGTITADGNISGTLRHTRAPRGWKQTQTREARLSNDGDTISGQAHWQGGKAEFRWVRITDEQFRNSRALAAKASEEFNFDRFAKERRVREAEITKEIARLHKRLDEQKRLAPDGIGNEAGIITEGQCLEAELAEIKKDPRGWAPALRMDVGAVGRFYRDGERRIQIVQIVDKQNMIAKYGNTRIWIDGVDTSTWTDGRLVHLPGVFRVVSNKTYGTASGTSATVLLVQPDR